MMVGTGLILHTSLNRQKLDTLFCSPLFPNKLWAVTNEAGGAVTAEVNPAAKSLDLSDMLFTGFPDVVEPSAKTCR